MKRMVEIMIPNGVEHKDNCLENVVIEGRLLGAVTIMEATKILQNQEISRRLATAETVSLADTLKAVESIDQTEVGADRYSRLVVAVKALKTERASEKSHILTRQLYLTPPISFVSEVRTDEDLTFASLWVNDVEEELITIHEKGDK